MPSEREDHCVRVDDQETSQQGLVSGSCCWCSRQQLVRVRPATRRTDDSYRHCNQVTLGSLVLQHGLAWHQGHRGHVVIAAAPKFMLGESIPVAQQLE